MTYELSLLPEIEEDTKFDKRIWRDRDAGVVSYGGNHVKFQNRFGAWQRLSYWCNYNPDTRAAKLVMLQ